MGLPISELERRVYDRMDEGASQYISTQQVDDVIAEGFNLLISLYMSKEPLFFESETQITPLINVRDYALPMDFQQETKVSWVPMTNANQALQTYVPMKRTMRDEYLGVPTSAMGAWPSASYVPTFEIYNTSLRLNPTPTVTPSFAINVWYVPKLNPPGYSVTLDDRLMAGHEQFIINHAAMMLKIKEEVDYSQLAQMQQMVRAAIDSDLNNRYRNTGQRIVDNSSINGDIF